MTNRPTHCAIDFGTSNSAIAVPADAATGTRLVPVEGEHLTMPTAVFYFTEHDVPLPAGAPLPRAFGRAAVAAYVEAHEGRLMRSMKSILGSSLVEQTTDVGSGYSVRYLDVITSYLAHLKEKAETAAGGRLDQVVLGRPVFFVDDDPQRDRQAQASLEAAARDVGFTEIAFQYEPLAAAFDFEATTEREQRVLVADIGGGTSDFSVVRVGPKRMHRLDRREDILANHGVHVAGTDFDRRIELACILTELGFRALGPSVNGAPGREVPSAVYFDLATWHLINTVYNPQRVAELRSMASFYADPAHHRRLMTTLTERLGHDLVGRAEAAKIAVAQGGTHVIDLGWVERGLSVTLDEAQAERAMTDDIERIVAAARRTVADAGLQPQEIDALYFTGGSTGLRLLTDRLAAAFDTARPMRGDRLASVATGLGLYATRRFAPQSAQAA